MRVIAIPNPSYPPDEEALALADVTLRSIGELVPVVIDAELSVPGRPSRSYARTAHEPALEARKVLAEEGEDDRVAKRLARQPRQRRRSVASSTKPELAWNAEARRVRRVDADLHAVDVAELERDAVSAAVASVAKPLRVAARADPVADLESAGARRARGSPCCPEARSRQARRRRTQSRARASNAPRKRLQPTHRLVERLRLVRAPRA